MRNLKRKLAMVAAMVWIVAGMIGVSDIAIYAEDFSLTEFKGEITVEKKAPGVSVVYIAGLREGQAAVITAKTDYKSKEFMEMEYKDVLNRGLDSRLSIEVLNQLYGQNGGIFTESVEVKANDVTSMEAAMVCIYDKMADGSTYKLVQIALIDIPYLLEEAKIYYDLHEITDVNQLTSGERYLMLSEPYDKDDAVASIPKCDALIYFAGTDPDTARYANIHGVLSEEENKETAKDVSSLWHSTTRLLYTPQAAISFIQTGTEFGGVGHGLMGYDQGRILKGLGWYCSYSVAAVTDYIGPRHLYSYKSVPLTEDLVTVTYNNSTFEVREPGAVTLDIRDFKAVADINGIEYEIPYIEFALGDDNIDPAVGDTTVKIALENLSYEVSVPVLGKYVCGKVVDKDGNILPDLKAELKQGDTVLQTVMTDAAGIYTFTNVDAGEYQVVVTYGDSSRILNIIKEDKILTNATISFAPGEKRTGQEVDTNMPEVVVENLDRIYGVVVTDGNKGFTQEDHDKVKNGSDADIVLTMKKLTNMTEHAEDIQKLADKQNRIIGMYLDLSIDKIITEWTGDQTRTNLIELPEVITLKMELEEELQNKGEIVIYRYHQGDIDVIKADPNADGESVTVSEDGKTIIIKLRKFSTYAIGYNSVTESGTTAGSTTEGLATTESTTAGEKKSDVTPETGDAAPIVAVVLLMAVAAGVAGTIVRSKNR